MSTAIITIDSISTQIRNAVHALKLQNVMEPYKVQLSPMQFDLLSWEVREFANHFSVSEKNTIYGCEIEVKK